MHRISRTRPCYPGGATGSVTCNQMSVQSLNISSRSLIRVSAPLTVLLLIHDAILHDAILKRENSPAKTKNSLLKYESGKCQRYVFLC